MATSKPDRLLRQLALRERTEEDLYFTAHDRELLHRLHEASEEEHRAFVGELAHARCPECGARLVRERLRGVVVQSCPRRHGLWMTESEMRTVARRERDSWISRYLYRPKPVV